MIGIFVVAGGLFGLAALGLLYQSANLLVTMPAPGSPASIWTAYLTQLQMSFLHVGVAFGLAAVLCFATAAIIATIEGKTLQGTKPG